MSNLAIAPETLAELGMTEEEAEALISEEIAHYCARGLSKYQTAGLAREVLDVRDSQRRIPALPSWNAALGGGLRIPSFTVLGAKPKCGKSTICAHVADAVTRAGHFVFMLDLENGIKRTVRRFMSIKSNVGLDGMREHELQWHEKSQQWKHAEKELINGRLGQRLFIATDRRMDSEKLGTCIAEISALARATGKEALVIIDSLQKLWLPNLNDRRGGIDAWLRAFEEYRDKYNVAILMTSELKRSDGSKYQSSEVAMKESGDIEYTADLVVALDRPPATDRWIDGKDDQGQEQMGQDDLGNIKQTVLFNRDGPSGRLRSDLRLVFPHHGIEEVEANARS